MADAAVAKLIAGSLHQLPHPKHGEIRLMGFRPTALAARGLMTSQHPQEVHDKVNAHAQAIGEGVVELVERNGKTIVDTAELEHLRAVAATQEPGGKVAHGYCAHCASELIRLAVDDKLNAQIHRVAIETMGIPHACWDR